MDEKQPLCPHGGRAVWAFKCPSKEQSSLKRFARNHKARSVIIIANNS